MKLTENFTLEELIYSQTASSLGITEQYNPPALVVQNLKELCIHVLQPLRDRIGMPVGVNSGYRSQKTNKAVGGVNNSQHLSGEAADLRGMDGMTNAELFSVIKSSDLPFDQLIWEYGTKKEPRWVHVSYTSDRAPRKMVLYIGIK